MPFHLFAPCILSSSGIRGKKLHHVSCKSSLQPNCALDLHPSARHSHHPCIGPVLSRGEGRVRALGCRCIARSQPRPGRRTLRALAHSRSFPCSPLSDGAAQASSEPGDARGEFSDEPATSCVCENYGRRAATRRPKPNWKSVFLSEPHARGGRKAVTLVCAFGSLTWRLRSNRSRIAQAAREKPARKLRPYIIGRRDPNLGAARHASSRLASSEISVVGAPLSRQCDVGRPPALGHRI